VHVNGCCATTYITGHKKLKKLDNVKIGNLKGKNRDHKKYLNKMKMHAGNLQVLLQLRSLFGQLLFKNS